MLFNEVPWPGRISFPAPAVLTVEGLPLHGWYLSASLFRLNNTSQEGGETVQNCSCFVIYRWLLKYSFALDSQKQNRDRVRYKRSSRVGAR